jgi:predicted enzyme related to lactoylglutathione lyase
LPDILGIYITLRRYSMANPFVHIELQSQDLEKSKKFYAGMFDWKLEEMPGMDYTIINVGEGTGGGMMKKPDPGIPDNWLPYIMVNDIAASTKKAQTLGATICKDVTEVPDMGWFSVITDTTGATFGLWQPKMSK